MGAVGKRRVEDVIDIDNPKDVWRRRDRRAYAEPFERSRR